MHQMARNPDFGNFSYKRADEFPDDGGGAGYPPFLHDDPVEARIPSNCYRAMHQTVNINGTNLDIPVTGIFPIKTVDRTELINKPDVSLILYRYSERVLREMNPINLSFLLTHEWLWDFTQDPALNLKMNQFFQLLSRLMVRSIE